MTTRKPTKIFEVAYVQDRGMGKERLKEWLIDKCLISGYVPVDFHFGVVEGKESEKIDYWWCPAYFAGKVKAKKIFNESHD